MDRLERFRKDFKRFISISQETLTVTDYTQMFITVVGVTRQGDGLTWETISEEIDKILTEHRRD